MNWEQRKITGRKNSQNKRNEKLVTKREGNLTEII